MKATKLTYCGHIRRKPGVDPGFLTRGRKLQVCPLSCAFLSPPIPSSPFCSPFFLIYPLFSASALLLLSSPPVHLWGPPQSSYGVWGARCTLPSGSGQSSAEKRFLVHSELKITCPLIALLTLICTYIRGVHRFRPLLNPLLETRKLPGETDMQGTTIPGTRRRRTHMAWK